MDERTLYTFATTRPMAVLYLDGMSAGKTVTGTLDAQDMLADSVEAGVAYLPGWSFFAGDPDRSTMRLSFVTHSPAVIEDAIGRLGEVIARHGGR